MTLFKVFHGDLTGTGTGEMLATMAPGASGAYVAMERVNGSVGGHAGSFALVHRGLMDKGAQDLMITIVPGFWNGRPGRDRRRLPPDHRGRRASLRP